LKFQAFIFNWQGKKQHATLLETIFRRLCDVTVINSDDDLRISHPHWHHLGNDAYFTEQWNAALRRFDADIFVHIQADIWPIHLGRMLSECHSLMRNDGVGIYAPNVNFNPHVFRRESLVRVRDGVYEVPATDCSFWAISADVLQNVPPVDPGINKLGWGIEYLVGAVARRRGLKIVRDYRFTAGHVKSRGYDNAQASTQWNQFRKSVEPTLLDEMNRLIEQRDRLVVNNSSGKLVLRASKALNSRILRGALIFRRRLQAIFTPLSLSLLDKKPAKTVGDIRNPS
jgi:hypothetical protein